MAATMKSVFWELRNDLGQRVRRVRQNQREKLCWNSKYSNAAPLDGTEKEPLKTVNFLSTTWSRINNINVLFAFARPSNPNLTSCARSEYSLTDIWLNRRSRMWQTPVLVTHHDVCVTKKSTKAIYYLVIFIKLSHGWISLITWVCWVPIDPSFTRVGGCWGTCGGDKHLCADLHS